MDELSSLFRDSIKKLIKGTSYIVIIRILTGIVSVGFIAIMTRNVPTDKIGIYFIMLQFANILSIFCRLGTDLSNQRFLSEAMAVSPSYVPSIFKKLTFIMFAGTGLIITFLILSWGLFERLFYSQILDYLLFYQILMIIVISLEKYLSSSLRAIDKIFVSSITDTFVRQITAFCILVFTSLFTNNIINIYFILKIWILSGFLGIIAGWFIMIKSNIYLKGIKTGTIRIHTVWDMFKISFPMSLANAAELIRGGSDLMIIGWIIGPHAAGLYGPLKKLQSIVVLIYNAINQMLAPIISSFSVKNRKEEMESICRTAANISFLVSGIFTIFFLIIGKNILIILFGSEYSSMYYILLILLSGIFIKTLFGAPDVVMRMNNLQNILLKINFVICFITIGLMILLSKLYGLYGVSIVTSLLIMIQYYWFYELVREKLQINTLIKLPRY